MTGRANPPDLIPLGRGSTGFRPFLCPYPPECLEGTLCELRAEGVLGSSHQIFSLIRFSSRLGDGLSGRVVLCRKEQANTVEESVG